MLAESRLDNFLPTPLSAGAIQEMPWPGLSAL
jgi:hypothetical protein